jgi:hypothetical protein
MGFVISTGNRHKVQNCSLDRQKLEQIADILGIARADRDDLLFGGVSIHIYAGARPTPGAPPTTPGGGPSPSPPSGRAPPSPTRRRRRQSE